MKILPVIALLSIILSTITSCTTNAPDRIKVQNAVEHYLDSFFKGRQVDIRGFATFRTMKAYFTEEKTWAYKGNTDFFKYHPEMSEKDRIKWRKSTDEEYADLINREKGYWIHCFYNIDFRKYQDDFWVEPDFKTVHLERIIE